MPTIDRYDVYSLYGRLLHSTTDRDQAERWLGSWYSAKCVIGVAKGGERVIIAERPEVHCGELTGATR